MEFSFIEPSLPLKSYVKHYFLFRSIAGTAFNDVVFPSGEMEVIFNLGSGTWERMVNGQYEKTPAIELWGQITAPLAIRSAGCQVMLGIRFLTHSASYFFRDQIAAFNNVVTDLTDVLGHSAQSLHQRLLDTPETTRRIFLIEAFLLQRLRQQQNFSSNIDKVADILNSLMGDLNTGRISQIASRHGITMRYLQRLLHQHTGLSPKVLDKINRFQQSLKMLNNPSHSLTAIAYSCGYFDQSHFIRDFKGFTGLTPTAYLQNQTPINQLLK
ncbi:helix-turn-helix domain-containing protein [Pedobacter sp. SYP-B3415]|uniref:helix-turn-helix domain-containing protein n=1 Tax=Pedobacter sp. SYP-B3415 TaxID=2496641 RepID=UPI0013E9A795|nr:helix-turn-helix domain-containing protein [Pedobacter sp. SYP-B3415]